MMKVYKLTVFEQTGESIYEDSFEAPSDDKAKEIGKEILEEKGYADHTHRCASPLGKLILFHP
ncbi:YhzD family protein [Bacillus sp. SCS-153A]|uniref:YhzD family protein n=1 Tax=Rossellomorea sedimentorum TaxID=3115294 RepID=UPI003906D013